MQRSLIKFATVLISSLVFVAIGIHAPAKAEGRCPPGYYPTGGGISGWLGCAPMGPMNEGNGWGNNPSYLPPTYYSPEEWAEWVKIAREKEEGAEAERKKDPFYRELAAGVWDFGKPDKKMNDNVCFAIFLHLRGGVLLMDWKGEHGGTFIAFYGGKIPKVGKIKKAKVTLTQSGEKQSVTAFHGPLPWQHEIGMIMLAVPSTQALLSSIDDVQDFDLEMNGQPMVSGEWHSGLQARKHLTNCVAQR